MFVDYYEVLQISPNADQETVHRVYRLQAQRFHPDNQETGNAEAFRSISDAYQALGDPESAPSTTPSIVTRGIRSSAISSNNLPRPPLSPTNIASATKS